jgi:putative CRISPR-associated protein (TIGR02619 family)
MKVEARTMKPAKKVSPGSMMPRTVPVVERSTASVPRRSGRHSAGRCVTLIGEPGRTSGGDTPESLLRHEAFPETLDRKNRDLRPDGLRPYENDMVWQKRKGMIFTGNERTDKPLFVVSTCGTSLLTNRAPGDLNALLRRTANQREDALAKEDRSAIDARILDRQEALKGSTLQEARDLSAELNGLLGIYDDDLSRGANNRNHHVFLHTDTYQGVQVGKLLLEWAQRRGLSAEAHRVDNLNTARMEEFREGMGNLADWCADALPGYRDGGYRVVFNLIGGFKALQGFMQTLGMFYADESVYLFEGERALLRIPGFPWTWTKGPDPSCGTT